MADHPHRRDPRHAARRAFAVFIVIGALAGYALGAAVIYARLTGG